MKKKKTLIILCLVLIAAIAGIAIESRVEKHIDKVNTIDEEVFALETDEVIDITIDKDTSSLNLAKVDDSWKNADDESFPIDSELVQEFIDHFKSVHASFIIEDVEDYEQYGLKNPEAKVVFTTEDGEKTMTFGTFSTMDSKRYICVDDKDVYLIDEDLLEYVSSDKDSFIAGGKVPDFTQINTVSASNVTSFNAKYDPDGDYSYSDKYEYWYENDGKYLPLSTDYVEKFVETLQNLDLSTYKTYSASSDEISKYKLNLPDLTVTITGEVAVEDSEDTEQASVTINFASINEDTVYAKFDDSNIIYSVDPEVYKTISETSYSTLRPDEIMDIDFTNVKNVVCRVEGETYNIECQDKGDDGVVFNMGSDKVDFTAASGKIQAMSVEEAGNDYEKGQEELAYTVNLNDDAGTVLEVVLYRYDGDDCVATLNGETIGLVNRSSMANLREAIISSILNIGKEDNSEN